MNSNQSRNQDGNNPKRPVGADGIRAGRPETRNAAAGQTRLTPEQLRARAASIKRKKHEKSKARSRRFLLFLFVFILLLAAVIIYIAITFRLTDQSEVDKSDVKYYYGTGDDDAYERVSYSVSERNGVRYINFTQLAKMLSLTMIGDGDTLRYVISSSDTEEAVFKNGMSDAVINNTNVSMSGAAQCDSSGNLWVPLDFVTGYMSGVIVTFDEKTHSVTVLQSGVPAFTIKPQDTITPVSEETDYGDTTEPVSSASDTEPGHNDEVPAVEFKSDLSEYEKYMNPADRDAYLVLVNADNALDEDYLPVNLTDVKNTRDDGRSVQKLSEYAARALEALFIELYACGYDDKGPGGYPVTVMSAYRSYSYQNQLFNGYVEREMNDDNTLTREQAEAITETYSARPGTSEHQTGLCADMHNLSSAGKAFANEEEYAWLTENCWKFGYVLRFPDGKTDITGITYEPWHYRYVGRYHAYMMKKLDMCLEEYVEYLK